MEAELALLAPEDAPEVAAVLPDDEPADDETQEQQNPVLVEHPGHQRECNAGGEGAKGNPFGHHGEDEKAAPADQGQPPVEHDGDGAAGECPCLP